MFKAFWLNQADPNTAGVVPDLRDDCIERYRELVPVMLDHEGEWPTDSLPERIPAVLWAADPPPDRR